MKVLIVSTNTLPASPSGPAYLAGAARRAGHEVEVFECLFAKDLAGELRLLLERFKPEVVAISIRLVHGDVQDPTAPFGTRYLDLRPGVKRIVDVVRSHSAAQIVLGGPGFGYYASDWLDYLALDYGICGEGEEAFPRFLQTLAEGGDIHAVPGSVWRSGGQIRRNVPRLVEDLESQALPAYDLFDWAKYAEHRVLPAIFTKRGCAFDCTFCPYAKLAGKRYRLKSPERVLAEVRQTLEHSPGRRIMFCDNSFNVPLKHAAALCRAFLSQPVDFQWGTGDLKPIGIDNAFCQLMRDSGCYYVNLAVESASDAMLRRMRRGYTVRQVRESLDALCRSGIPFGASLMLGAPGESPQTVAETLRVMDDYEFPLGVWVTVGVYLWTELQDVVSEARRSGLLRGSQSLFAGPVYLSPELPSGYVEELILALRTKPGYTVQVNHPSAVLTSNR